ncbi:phage tail tube protein [Streptococcus suis]|uniref:phage tail tube protein n=1 Tax=Streptococcus suis TaxID=1307 RepID=UPI001478A32B
MPKNKNALRKHFVAPFNPESPLVEPNQDAYLWLAKDITTSSPEIEEETEEEADFAGDGTPITTVTSVKRGRTFEGIRNIGDKAQDFIAALEDEVGDARLCWYKEISADGKTAKSGVATVSEIEIGDGDAKEFEKFKCKIAWNQKPKTTSVVPG